MKLEIRTYCELANLIQAWATKRRIPLLAITSRPGLGKTEAARSTATRLTKQEQTPLALDTHVTPMQLYVDLFNHRDQPVILDDLTDRVLKNDIALSILKSLCDSREERRVEYNSSSLYLDQHDIPRSFTTRSPVLLLSNVFAVVSPAQFALQSRAIHADFCPPVLEVLAYVRTWAKDLQLVDWFAARRDQFPMFSARDYAVCEQLRDSGLDWQDFATRSVDPLLAEVVSLQARFGSDEQRVTNFSGSRMTYYRKKALVREYATYPATRSRPTGVQDKLGSRKRFKKPARKPASKRRVIARDGKPVPF